MVELSPFKIKDKTILTAPNHSIDAELGPEAREVRRRLALDPDCYYWHPSVIRTRFCIIIPIVLVICLWELLRFTRFAPALQIMMKSELSRFALRLIGFLCILFVIYCLASYYITDCKKIEPVRKKQVHVAIMNSLSIMGFNQLDQKRITTYLLQNNDQAYFNLPSILAEKRTFYILRDIPGIDTSVIDLYEKYLEEECMKATGYKSYDALLNEQSRERQREIDAEHRRQEQLEAERRAKIEIEREKKINEVHQHFVDSGIPVTREQSAIIADTFGTGGLIYSDLQTLTRGQAHLPVDVARAAIASYNQVPMSGSTKELGNKGEDDVKYRLEWFIKEHPECALITKDCTSKYSDHCILLSAGPGEEPQEFDFLLLGRFGLVALEVKNYSADTVRVESDSTWILEGSAGNKLIESPVDQVRRHEYVLRRILGVFPVQSLIVLANSNQAVIGTELSSVPVVSIRDLKAVLSNYTEMIADNDVLVAHNLIEQHKCRK